MTDSHEMIDTSRSYDFISRLKFFIAERLLPFFNLTTYNRLKIAQQSVETLSANLYELREHIIAIEEYKERLESSNERLEQLRFQLTGKIVTQYTQANPHSSAPSPAHTDISSTQAQERMHQLQALVKQETLPLDVLSIIDSIPETYDAIYKKALRPLYEQRIIDATPNFWDVRMALNALSRILQPRCYLEIGTRVGWSLSQVLAHSPHTQVYSFDMWIEHYGGVDNPGQEFVRNMMSRVTAPVIPQITFISGNSHNTLPQFFQPERYTPSFSLPRSRPTDFDLITVDGDHNIEGAWMDLMAVMPHIAVGGAIVFDDIELTLTNSDIEVHSETDYPSYYPPLPTGVQSLGDVWNAIKRQFPNFTYIESINDTISVGIGIRLS